MSGCLSAGILSKRYHQSFSLSGSLTTLVFLYQTVRNIPTGTPPLQEGYEKIAIFDQYDEEKEREHNLVVRSGKPEAEITNNKIRRSRYRTAEANTNRQTQSIAQPLCDSRATCSSFK